MEDIERRKLSKERLEEIRVTLVGAGLAQAAAELAGHIEALEDQVTVISQYYEEVLVPEIEGHWKAIKIRNDQRAAKNSGEEIITAPHR